MALASAVALAGCTKDTTTTVEPAPPTVGSLNVNVTPASASVVVTGPSSYSKTFTGNYFLDGLAPGQYSASATATGFAAAASSINVVAGETSSISLILQPLAPIAEAPRAVYRDADGHLVPLTPESLQSGQFVFYAWLKDEPLGIDAVDLGASSLVGDPGKPLLSEQEESAPSFTQNLAVAWVGFVDATGVVRPVIGADVRWEIDQWWLGRIHSTQFGTSDDNRVALGYGVFDDQADTRTNNASLENERFPLVASEYPLYNGTGIGTPFIDGLTWVTLFSPDAVASSRIVAVATVEGEEIGKQILFKSFAPAPVLVITKNVDQAVVVLDSVTQKATVNWTVTVTNVGAGDATNVSLADFLASGSGAAYTAAGFPGTANGDGFNYTFDLPAAPVSTVYPLGDAKSFAVLAKSTVTNTPTSTISGDVGVSAGTAVTGLLPADVKNGTIHNNDGAAQAAQTALGTAYAGLIAKACTGAPNTPLSNGHLGPGVYCYDSTAGLTGPLVLDGHNNPNAEFVFRIGSALTTASASSVTLINGANPCNVYWLIGSSATLGTGTAFAGNILAVQSITANAGATVSGRLLANTGAVTLDSNAISAPLACAFAPSTSAETFKFSATVTQPGTWCNEAQVLSFSSVTNTWTPVDLSAQACFTALASHVGIVKDFVDNTTNPTSLGKAVTLTANETAWLRVQVIDTGAVDATGVTVTDAFSSPPADGAIANYQISNLSKGTLKDADANGKMDSFDANIGTVAKGTTSTLFFQVQASVDGKYCDTVTLTAPGSTIDIGTDSACLTVATPKLEIATKADAPASVFPGDSYTSTIVVTNTGNATARNVVVKDLVGSLSPAGTVFVVYVSSSQGGAGGILAGNVVTAPNMVDIPAGGSMTFLVVSRIPAGAVSGDYCDTATVTSSNAPTAEKSACVHVPSYAALQTQLVDLNDPVFAGTQVSYSTVIYVEARSNEGVNRNVLTYFFGLETPTSTQGKFPLASTKVYLDTAPVRDPVTGLVVSNSSNATAVLLTEGTDYTLDNSTSGKQVLTMKPNSFALQPNQALYVEHVCSVPTTITLNHLYTTSYTWVSWDMVDTTTQNIASSSEPTTVLAP